MQWKYLFEMEKCDTKQRTYCFVSERTIRLFTNLELQINNCVKQNTCFLSRFTNYLCIWDRTSPFGSNITYTQFNSMHLGKTMIMYLCWPYTLMHTDKCVLAVFFWFFGIMDCIMFWFFSNILICLFCQKTVTEVTPLNSFSLWYIILCRLTLSLHSVIAKNQTMQ